MSGINAFTRTPLTTSGFGPRRQDPLELRGIRFLAPAPDDGAGGGGGGGGGNEGGAGNGGGNQDGGSKYTPPASQEELDRIIGERIARERAKVADYDQLKNDSKELAKLREEKKTADEKALDAAREEGRTEVRQILALERVKTTLERELQGRVPNAAALLDLDRSSLIKDGSANVDAIKAWVLANSTEAKPQKQPRDPGQGNRDTTGGSGTTQAGREAFENRRKKTTTS